MQKRKLEKSKLGVFGLRCMGMSFSLGLSETGAQTIRCARAVQSGIPAHAGVSSRLTFARVLAGEWDVGWTGRVALPRPLPWSRLMN
jgi:hypothetical protein